MMRWTLLGSGTSAWRPRDRLPLPRGQRAFSYINLTEALEMIDRLAPKRAFLTHLSHHFDYEEISPSLPESVSLAYDGLRIEIPFSKAGAEAVASRSAERNC